MSRDNRLGPGRPRSIPESHFETILQRYDQGDGYRRIATYLRSLGVSTTHTAVRRLIKGEGAYAECRNPRTKALQETDHQKILSDLIVKQLPGSADGEAG